jgi:hypothetical protein
MTVAPLCHSERHGGAAGSFGCERDTVAAVAGTPAKRTSDPKLRSARGGRRAAAGLVCPLCGRGILFGGRVVVVGRSGAGDELLAHPGCAG